MNRNTIFQWPKVVEKLTPYIVRISTPAGSGTGCFIRRSKKPSLVTIATAQHVISHAHYWEEPIRVELESTNQAILLHHKDRLIYSPNDSDSAAITFNERELKLPTEELLMTPEDKYYKAGNEVGWLGYPAIPYANLCFFSGRISAWIQDKQSYLIDGVAINGVSGGPAFTPEGRLVGVVSAYVPNRATGESLPGLLLVEGVDRLQEIVKAYKSFDEEKAEEAPPSEPSQQSEDI